MVQVGGATSCDQFAHARSIQDSPVSELLPTKHGFARQKPHELLCKHANS